MTVKSIKSKDVINPQKGFTLIELLVVIGILAILLSIVLIAINPARQFGQANNTQRRSNVTAILNAIGAYSADNHGNLPAGITTTAVDAGTTSICSAVMPTYISALPVDPSLNKAAITDCTGNPVTDYMVVKDSSGRVTVSASVTDNGEVINITR